MPNEITLNLSWTLNKSNHKDSFQPGTKAITQTGVGAHCPVVSVGTSEEDLAVGDIGTLGWLTIQNLDATNYVQWGPKSSGSMVAIGRLKPGEIAHLRLEPGITLRWVANTGACKVLVKLLED